MITAGGVTSIFRPLSFAAPGIAVGSPPNSSTSASLTIFTTCCPGVTDRITSAPTARAVTSSTNVLTTGNATSASSSATRTSRIAARTSISVSAPRPRSFSKTLPRRSERLSNKRLVTLHMGNTRPKRNYAGGRNLVGRRASLDARAPRLGTGGGRIGAFAGESKGGRGPSSPRGRRLARRSAGGCLPGERSEPRVGRAGVGALGARLRQEPERASGGQGLSPCTPELISCDRLVDDNQSDICVAA